MAQEIMNLPVAALKPHPRNEEFFSNIEGEDFKRLKDSIAELGILTPLRVAADMTLVSGHQRYRAAKELGLVTVPVIIDTALSDEDGKIAQLIAANFGRTENLIDKAKWIAEYERVRGVRQGSAGQAERQFVAGITQEDIAKELGIDVKTVQRLKKLNNLIPEFQDIINEGKVTASTGYNLIASLSPEEQRKLLESLPETEKITAKKMESYITQIKGEYEAKVAALEKTVTQKSDEVIAMRNTQLDQQLKHDQRLVEENRKYFENWQAEIKSREKVDEELNKVKNDLEVARENLRKATLKAALKESPEGMEQLNSKIAELENEISELNKKLSDAEEQIENANQNHEEGFLRYAIPDIADARHELEDVSALCARIQTAVASYLTDVRSISRESDRFNQIKPDFAAILLDTISDAISETKLLYGALSSQTA